MAAVSPVLAALLQSGGGGGGGDTGLFGLLSKSPALGFGFDVIGSILSTRSKRRQMEELRTALAETLKPQQAALQERKFGLSQTEGRLAQGATSGALTDLSQRGVLDSSFAPGEVLQATAPFELQRQRDIQQGETALASARQQIAAGTSLPGYGAALGSSLGDVGEFFALRGGQEEGKRRAKNAFKEALDEIIGGSNG